MSKIQNENFVCIQGWMVNDLGLKGNALLIYAIIYGFSQAEGQTFNGSLQYLADWTNSTKQGVIKAIKKLLDDGLINKNEKFVNNVKFVEYYVTKFDKQLNKVERGIKQSLPNNKEDNITNNIDTTTKVVEAEPPKSYGNEDINNLFDSWEQACGFPITSKVKANRFACNRLIRSKGKDVIIQVLPIVAESHSDQFAPSIVNFMDLEQKWNNLGIWYRKKCATKNKHTIRVV